MENHHGTSQDERHPLRQEDPRTQKHPRYNEIIDLEYAIFNSESNDDFTVKVVETVEKAYELVEASFECLTDIDHKKIFRKRK